MLTPVLDPHASHPLYEQIYRHIRREIEGGVLRPGERLPSKRALAAHLKVGVITVENAYEQLLAEGYVYTRAKRGFFVQSPGPGRSSPPPAAPSVLPPPPPTRRAVLPYDFSTNAVDTEHFPFSTWARLMREVLSEEDSALLSSPHPQGVPALRAAIVRSLHDFRGIDVHPDQIVVGAGAEYLTTLLFQLLGQCGGWAVEDPGYRKVQRILSHTGALVCPIPLDQEGLRTDALRWSGARVVHVTPSHHFPLGTVMSMPRRRPFSAGPGNSRTGISLRTIMTASSALTAVPSPRSKAWTGTSGSSTSTPLPRVWPPPSGSDIWCCRPT